MLLVLSAAGCGPKSTAPARGPLLLDLVAAFPEPTCGSPHSAQPAVDQGRGIVYLPLGCRVDYYLRLPGTVAAGKVSQAPVQLVDVPPTVLDAVGVPRDRWPAMEGRSLLREDPPADRPIFAEYMRSPVQRRRFAEVDPGFDFDRYDRRLRSIQVGAMKLILADRGPAELYDLSADPGETRNLAAERPELAAELGARLEAWSGGWRPAPSVEGEPVLDEATRQALRSLGYLD